MVLADEGLNGNIVRFLREKGFEVHWILEISSGISDEEVIRYAKDHTKILITEDKDFGEWVFAHKIDGLTIIFLRYTKEEYEQIVDFLRLLLPEIENLKSPPYQFITINKNKIRRREI